ncbi:DUF3087 family protein [Oceanisphaera avium]|uniref:DUF3087 domain-containing protein n=1 Tax=Oceanisphaera avium TaxID=1903694 RepID=A0A1Y0CW19_9GAMM|nr:DUF3087 family protein [Oceanisphaera avium]ART79214.1 hypothetical protein CBP12_02845 [Oceanisphaera avium]
MTLIDIDKVRYRRHLNHVFIGSGVALAVLSLSLSQLLIFLFPDDSGSHFHWNALGVVIAAAIVGFCLSHYRHHTYLREVLYVWELKRALNKITRKMRKVEAAAQQGNEQAMQTLQFSYAGSRQLWQLDDNIIIMEELAIKQAELDALAERYKITLDAERYQEHFLTEF